MRYLVKARVKPGKEQALLTAIEDGRLGRGAVAGDEYLWDMQQARIPRRRHRPLGGGLLLRIPLEEERPYWEEYFDLICVKDAHARQNCRDLNSTEPWACSKCDARADLKKSSKARANRF